MAIYDSFDNDFWSILEMWERELDEETVQREKLFLSVNISEESYKYFPN